MKKKIWHLYPAEAFVFRVTLAATLIDMILIFVRGSRVDLAAYAMLAVLVCALLILGHFYRRSGRSEAIGAMTIGAGLFIFFTATLSLFNYLLTPTINPAIDPWLIKVDAAWGYHWPDIIAWAANHPIFNEFMRFAYMSTLAQIALLVIVLGLTMRLADLHSLMIAVVVSGMIAVMFWGLFPSTGAMSYYVVSPDLSLAVNPVVDRAYGMEILALLKEGAPFLSPNELRGLIGFPSYHIVLACAATYYARNVRWLFAPLFVVNLIVLPAVLVHGGHHLVDIPAGMVVFVIASYCAHLMLHAKRPLVPAAA